MNQEKEVKVIKKRGRPSKKTKKVKFIIPPPTPPPTPEPTPEPEKRIMTREDVDIRIKYLKKKLTTIKCPIQQKKYRNTIKKYQEDSIEII